MPLRIGSILLANPTIFAPLAGITNLPMRLLAKEHGCALVCSEMISANGLVHGSLKTAALLDSCPQEKPLSIQLFGSDPGVVAEAAARAAASGADIIDINFGCAVKKILKSGSGAALMQEPDKSAALMRAARRAVSVPLTIKMRSGWEPSGRQALELARLAQECGVDAVTLHPRTARQAFGGHADWNLIAKLKKTVDIPVIGNGDVVTAADAVRMLEVTGCDGVMLGRAAIGNPFIFSQILDMLAGRPCRQAEPARRLAVMRRYASASVLYLGEAHACPMMRSRLAWFVRGLPGASQFRQAITRITSLAEAEALISNYGNAIENRI